MTIRTLLIANRGEIALRIARAAAALGLRTVAVHPADDATSLHVRRCDEAVLLPGRGVKAYLDAAALVEVARRHGCDAVHPGYGFLSESADFAARLAEAGVAFVGPDVDTLAAFGDKVRARALAEQHGVPLLRGTRGATDLAGVRAFFEALPEGRAMMIKALAGGGGRGMRVVRDAAQVDAAFAACRSEAEGAFGRREVYAEEFLGRARHVEVQVIGDGSGAVSHLWERECSLQRRHQKLVEIAPAPTLAPEVRDRLLASALTLARAVRYRSLGTFEFLVADDGTIAFLEANPRLQVEHTVTEMVTGVDLVRAQLRIAGGATLADLGLLQASVPRPRGIAVQLRLNHETIAADDTVRPSGGTLTAYEPPAGPGVRVDGCGYAGYVPHPNFDSLLAKLIVHDAEATMLAPVLDAAYRALSEFRIEGLATTAGFLQNLLQREDVRANRVHTTFLGEHLAELTVPGQHPQRWIGSGAEATRSAGPAASIDAPQGTTPLLSPLPGSVLDLAVADGEAVRRGQRLVTLEAMKMEHALVAAADGIVRRIAVANGDVVREGQPLLFLQPSDEDATQSATSEDVDLDRIRPDPAELQARLARTTDAGRPDAVARRRKRQQRTARENLDDLIDPGSFNEYGALALAAQRRVFSEDELQRISPADGFVCGTASINGALFPEDRARAMVMAYDFTVFAGTQGLINHGKIDRVLDVAQQWKLPLVLFGEGGGGRPNDFADWDGVAGLDVTTFRNFAALSGQVPVISIVSGRCFAGNAALVGCSDVIIATENSNIGMGGPAMIEGGGLGRFTPEQVGPIDVQAGNGVVDVRVADEAAAVAVARQYLAYFQGPLPAWEAADPRRLRHLVPENRRQAYDIRTVIDAIADTGSVLELRRAFGVGAVTALIRIEGRPMGLIANNPHHLGGAIDAPACDKMARFLQLCDAFGLPVLSLCDTPGFMVGPESEKAAMVRKAGRLFVVSSALTVPMLTIVLRKGYGLGAQGMTAGHFHAPMLAVAWPTSEFGAMGLEGAVRLARVKELEAIADPAEREAVFKKHVAGLYERGKGLHAASYFEIDAVIDPAQSREWIVRGVKAWGGKRATGAGRRFVDSW